MQNFTIAVNLHSNATVGNVVIGCNSYGINQFCLVA